MDWLRGLGKLMRKVRPPRVYLVARLAPDGAATVAAFRNPDGAARCLVQQYRRRADRPSSSSASPSGDEIIQAYQALNRSRPESRDNGMVEFWAVKPVELVPPNEQTIPWRFQVEVFDLSALEDLPETVAACHLPGIEIYEGEVERRDHTRPEERPAPASETFEQVYLAAEWTSESDLSCFVFEDAATARRYTVQRYNEDVEDEIDDFRTAFRGLNRTGDDEDEVAFSLATVRLGRDRFVPILIGAEPARRVGAGRGFCDLPDTRIGQALVPEE